MTKREYKRLARASFLSASSKIVGTVKEIAQEDQMSVRDPKDAQATSVLTQTTLIAYDAALNFLKGAGVISITEENDSQREGVTMTRETYDELVARSLDIASEALTANLEENLKGLVQDAIEDNDGYLPTDITATLSMSVSAQTALIAFEAILHFLQDAEIIVVTD